MDNNERSLIVFLVCTANQVRIFDRIAKQFPADQYESYFLTCDQYYAQRAGSSLQQLNHRYSAIKGKTLPKDWCEMDSKERLPFLEHAASVLREFFASHRPDLLVVGNDSDTLEQLSLRIAEQFGTKTCRIQDGIQTTHHGHWDTDNREPGTVQMHPSIPFEGGTELLLTWSAETARGLANLGIGGKIEVAGSPLHDDLAQWSPPQDSSPPYRIVVAGQPFAKYGDMWVSQELATYDRIVQTLLQRDDVQVVFRPHPESNLLPFYEDYPRRFRNRVVLDTNPSLIETLKTSHGLVTISSTASLEAAAMGIPTARLDHLRTNSDLEYFSRQEELFQKSVGLPDFPKSLTLNVRGGTLETFTEWGLGTIDGQATNRAVRFLSSHINQQPTDTTSTPRVSALIESAGEDPVPAIRTIFRSDIPIEVLVMDRTPDGKLEATLKNVISAPNLHVHRCSNLSQEDALNLGLSKVSGEVILRVHPQVNCLPGLVSALERYLRDHAQTLIASSWFLGRDQIETFEGIVPVPETLNSQEMGEFGSYMLLSYCYAFRRSALSQLSGFRQSENADLDFIYRALSDNTTPLGVVQTALFLNPPIYRDPEQRSYAHHLRQYYFRAPTPISYSESEEGSKQELISKDAAERLLDEAVKLLQREQDRPAVNLINRILQHREDLPEAYYLKALAETRLKLLPLAKRTLSELLEKYPDHIEGQELFSQIAEH